MIAPRRNVVQGAQDNNNVVPMPGAVIDQAPLAPTADVTRRPTAGRALPRPARRWRRGSTPSSRRILRSIPRHFLSGARSAYEMIVLAFANGDRRALKDLLSTEVYESFETVIKDREKHEQKTETRFVSIDKAELVGAEARDRAAQLTVRFVSQMISVTRDKAGTIVDGNPDKVADITDVWTIRPRHHLTRSELEAGWHREALTDAHGARQMRRCVWRDRCRVVACSAGRALPRAHVRVTATASRSACPRSVMLPYPAA